MARKNEKISQEARNAFEKWHQYWSRNITTYNEFTEFVLGRQWLEEEEDMFITNKKVPLQVNKLATLCLNVIGEQQQNTPQLQVLPMDNCDTETASLRELIVKHIVLSYEAKTVYQVAASHAIIGGFGAYVVDTEYVNERSWEQDIIFRYLKDPTRCYWDVGAEHVNKIDGVCAGYLIRMSRQRFREAYGADMESKVRSEEGILQSEAEVALATDPTSLSSVFAWSDAEAITLNHYFKRKKIRKSLYKLSNGKSVSQDELDDIIEQSKVINKKMMEMQQQQVGQEAGILEGEGLPGAATEEAEIAGEEEKEEEEEEFDPDVMTLWYENEPVRIEDSRKVDAYKVMHYVTAGDYVLEESEFPCDLLPVVYIDQCSYYDKNGKQITRSFVADVKDTQRFLNYLTTQSAYTLKVSRYDQFIGSKKNVSSLDTQTIWKDPTVIQGLLYYDESPSGAKPEQLRPPELSQSLFAQYNQCVSDLYTSTGLYPSRLGEQGNEVSGAAIDARTRQGSYSTYNVFTNINRGIAAGGEIVNRMIPRVYDTERVITLMHPQEGQKSIVVNQAMDDYGIKVENDIRKGTYQVKLVPGPSYEGQKDQALQSMSQALQYNPQLFNLVADLFAENLPLSNTLELANRFRTLVPPEIIEAGKTGKSIQELKQGQQQQPDLQQMMMEKQAQLAEMEIQIKQKELDLKEKELILKAQAEQAELEQQMEKIKTERLQAAGQLEEQKLRYMAETQRTQSDASIAHANNLTNILTHRT